MDKESLIDLLGNDDPAVRYQAASDLSTIGTDDVALLLLRYIADPANIKRNNIVYRLRKCRPEIVSDTLLEIASNKPRDVCDPAMWALVNLREVRAIPLFLVKLAEARDEPEMDEYDAANPLKALYELCRLADVPVPPEAIAIFREMLNDPREIVRRTAMRYLERCGQEME